MKLRLDEDLHVRLEQAAREHGRSMNSELIRRLAASFTQDGAFGSSAAREVGLLAASAFSMAGRWRSSGEEGWENDPAAYRAAIFATVDALLAGLPSASADEVALYLEGLKGALLSRVMREKLEAET
jgi:hypothetical protein